MSVTVTTARTEYAIRFEPCLCGGELSAREGDWEDIRDAVVLHQEALQHVIWRARYFDAPVRSGSDPTPGLSVGRDVSGWPTAGRSVLSRTRLVDR